MKHQTRYLSLNHFLAASSLSISLVITQTLAVAEPGFAEEEAPAQASALEQDESLADHQNQAISISPDIRTVEEQHLYLVQIEQNLQDSMTESILSAPTHQDLGCGLSNVFIALCSPFKQKPGIN